MKQIAHASEGAFLYYWQPRAVGFIGIRVGLGHAWIIVGVAKRPEQLLVIGPGPAIPVQQQDETEEFREVRREVTAQHPELEQVLSGQLSVEEASRNCAASGIPDFTSDTAAPGRRTINRLGTW
jgi:hypothetical protein